MGGVIPIPTFAATTTVVRFEVPEEFTLVVNTFWVARAFEAYELPRTYRDVPEGADVPTPINPDGLIMDETFIVVKFALVTRTLVVTRELDASTFP